MCVVNTFKRLWKSLESLSRALKCVGKTLKLFAVCHMPLEGSGRLSYNHDPFWSSFTFTSSATTTTKPEERQHIQHMNPNNFLLQEEDDIDENSSDIIIVEMGNIARSLAWNSPISDPSRIRKFRVESIFVLVRSNKEKQVY